MDSADSDEESVPTSEDSDPYASGFAVSRRRVLATTAMVGLAGCGSNDDPETTDSATPSQTAPPTETPTPTPTESVSGLVDDDLTVVDSGFLSKQDGLKNYFRVRVRNDLSNQTMSSVGITVEFFDPDLQFLEHQNATIAYLGPQEVFEGYLTYFSDDAVAWAIRATRTKRGDQLESVTGLSVATDRIEDEAVRGVVENNGPQQVRRLALRVGFFDGDGDRVGTNFTRLTELPAGGSRRFSVDFPEALADPNVRVADYSVAVGDIDDKLLAIR